MSNPNEQVFCSKTRDQMLESLVIKAHFYQNICDTLLEVIAVLQSQLEACEINTDLIDESANAIHEV